MPAAPYLRIACMVASSQPLAAQVGLQVLKDRNALSFITSISTHCEPPTHGWMGWPLATNLEMQRSPASLSLDLSR
jgi:hypothetical protein